MNIDQSKLKSSVKKIQFSPPSSLFGETGEEVQQILLSDLLDFPDHPFRVEEDDNFIQLKESIQHYGVASPIIVREKEAGKYEIIAGHRRTKACRLLEMTEISAIVRDLDEEEAVFFMVDTNIQRESLRFSEKAFAYRMKMEALKQKAGRKKNGVPSEPQKKTRELLAANTLDSSAQIQRYIRLTYLNPDLLDMVDGKKLPFQVGVALSYLSEEEQVWVLQIMIPQKIMPNLQQAEELKKYSQSGKLTLNKVQGILNKTEKPKKKFILYSEVSQYFPPNTSGKEMEQVIAMLLQQWQKEQDNQ